MLGRNAGTGVVHGEHGTAVLLAQPLHLDGTTAGRVAHRVVDEVGQGALQFGRHTRNLAFGPQPISRRKAHRMRALLVLREQCRQGAALLLAALHQ